MCIVSVVALAAVGCSSENSLKQPPQQGAQQGSQQQVTLVSGGYGYEVGDVVLIDAQKEPAVGDVVQYDWSVNKSNCMAMGPGIHLAKVIGRLGDSVKFDPQGFTANGQAGSFGDGAGAAPRTKQQQGL